MKQYDRAISAYYTGTLNETQTTNQLQPTNKQTTETNRSITLQLKILSDVMLRDKL